MKIQTTNRYCKGDSRRFAVRFLFNGCKFSISLHPYLWYWRKYYREFRITILGLNLHYKEY